MGAQLAAISRELPVLLAGPTASGKSALAMELAARDGRVIVNADALQVYGCWRVLTARPSVADEAALPHMIYGHVMRGQDYSVGHWLREVQRVLADHGPRVVIVGGTGLYFSALTAGLADIPPTPPTVRQAADALRQADLAKMINDLDPDTRARVDLANPMRVQRAWEVQQSTGTGLAAWQAKTPAPALPLQDCTALVMRPDVARLNARIDQRLDLMVNSGALDEVRANLPDWAPAAPWAQAIGAAEFVAHLRGEMTLANALAAAKIATHQYAKRQRTWMRNRMAAWQELA
ncbi:MAG: tRNA (adenosine(37)-N6)-dimethylallyltransferase MiaA [Paracoccaceae bacterium]